MRLGWGPEEEAFRAELVAFLDEHTPREAAGGRDWIGTEAGDLPQWAVDWQAALFDHGWMVPAYPPEYGGRDATPLQTLVYQEEMGRRGIPRSVHFGGYAIVGPSLLEVGTEEQRSMVPAAIRGDTVWCVGMSEPNAGSDLAALSTRAVADGDTFVVNGQKVWTSYAAIAEKCFCYVRTDPEARKHKGISVLVIDMDTPGIEVRAITDMTTNRHFCEVFFEDVRVPAVNLVGVEGNAFKQTMAQLEHERGGIDRLVSNQALFEIAVERADRADPRIRQQIARIETGYRLGRILVTREVLRQAPKGFSAATKCFCTEHEQVVADFVAQVLGADAMLWDDVGKGLAYGPAYTIMGGTSDIMRNILGERVLGLPREPR